MVKVIGSECRSVFENAKAYPLHKINAVLHRKSAAVIAITSLLIQQHSLHCHIIQSKRFFLQKQSHTFGYALQEFPYPAAAWHNFYPLSEQGPTERCFLAPA